MARTHVFLLFLFFVTYAVLATAFVFTEELDSLQDLYISTSGDYWAWKDENSNGARWNFTGYHSPCDEIWQGINCDCNDGTCNIISINLFKHNLTGSIPSSISSLTQLRSLNLSSNTLVGRIPSELGTLLNLEDLALGANLLSHRIPTSIYGLAKLVNFDVSENRLSGTVGAEIGHLTSLQLFYLFSNGLTGQIPEELCMLPALIDVQLGLNRFNGSIPQNIGNMSMLQVLVLSDNELVSSLPKSIGQLSRLQVLDLFSNNLTGSIPPEIGNLGQLQVLHLQSNQLGGSIPKEIGQLTELVALELYKNQLTGPLPASVSALTKLNYLEVYSNKLSHGIPELGALRELMFLELNQNHFTGTVPPSVSELKKLLILDLSNNGLTGTLPESLGTLSGLQYLFFYQNHLAGTLPRSLINMTALRFIDVSNNAFTGSLPSGFTNINQLIYLDFKNNLLGGAIPSCVSNLEQLFFFDIHNNFFTGTIPRELGQLARLQDLFLHRNSLTGPVDQFINASVQLSLTNIDISNNQLTGNIPTEPFRIKKLQTFAAASNCLSGKLPESICEAEELTDLVLDGPHSAESCRDLVLKGVYRSVHTYQIVDRQKDAIPHCVYNMKNIQTLHLSGNGFSGSLPSDVVLGDHLTDLSLSHNVLYGSIPQQFLEHRWENLDLSYNKFQGQLPASLYFPPNGSLQLQVNRFSGRIPSSLLAVQDIKILDGNMFDCDAYGADESLPPNDEKAATYSCGSNSFNQSFNVWIIFFGLLLIALLLAALSYRSYLQSQLLERYFKKWCLLYERWMLVYEADESHSSELVSFGRLMRDVRYVVALLTAFLVLVLLPVYLALSAYYKSYDNAYDWVASGAFLSGHAPTNILYPTFLVFIMFVVYLYDKKLLSFPRTWKQWRFVRKYRQKVHNYRYYLFIALLGAVNFAVMIFANIFYVRISVHYNKVVVITAQMALAVFKLLWNSLVVFDAYGFIKRRYFSPPLTDLDETHMSILSITSGNSVPHRVEDKDILVQSFMVMFNNIGSPCLATALISTNCFYNVFFNPPTVDSSYSFLFCNNILIADGSCLSTIVEVHETSYDPPFIYSYQCSSFFITSYAAIYIYMYLIMAFGIPLLSLAVKTLHENTAQNTLLHKALNAVLPEMLKPLVPNRDSLRPVFKINQFMVFIMSSLGLMVTFGAIFPPLGVIIAISVCIHTIYIQMLLGRLVTEAEMRQFVIYKLLLEAECENAKNALHHVVWLLCIFASLFFAFFLFDMYGDQNGFNDAVWGTTIAATPIFIWLLLQAYRALIFWGVISTTDEEAADALGYEPKKFSGSGKVNYQLVATAINSDLTRYKDEDSDDDERR